MLNLNFRRRTEREEAILDKLITSPVLERALAEDEAEQLAERRATIEAIAKLDRERPAEIARLGEAVVLARRKHEVTAAAAFVALKEFEAASMRANGGEIGYLGARKELEQTLIAGADTRLFDMWVQLTTLRDNAMVDAMKFWAHPSPHRRAGGEMLYFSNTEELRKAREMVAELIAKCHQMQLAALGRVEVAEQLNNICAALAPVLEPLELNPPCLTAQHAEVGSPLTWGGSPAWIVETIPVAIKPDPAPKAARGRRI